MPDADSPRLIEVAFPLKQASLDSVHEKMCHSGHIKSLHIYPARRPLAACRAALIATLLPDPGTPEKRKKLLEKIGGKVVTEIKKKKVGGKTVEVLKARTVGGVLHWGNENSPDMDCFREEIKKAYGGRAPRVLDPFAGGGAIPLEAMRLGCEATAIDINAVAWFILKCTLEYPQQLAGQVRQLPKFAVKSAEFMEAFLRGSAQISKRRAQKELAKYQRGLFPPPEADLAWHVRAWGWWVLQEAGKELDQFYPAIDGTRTLAYLWARTTKCIKCRATVPLLKSLWLRKKGSKRVLLTVSKDSDRRGVSFGINSDVPSGGGNVAQQRDHDKSIGKGTISRSGATCPCCGAIIPTEDIRLEGQAGHLGSVMTAVVVESQNGKEFRLPTETDMHYNATIDDAIVRIFDDIPCGCPNEPVPQGASRVSGGSPFTIFIYGMTKWSDLYTKRQLVVIGSFLRVIRRCWHVLAEDGYNPAWCNAIIAYLCCVLNKVCDYNSSLVAWQKAGAKGANTFQRWALPFKWDFTENNVINSDSGGWAAVCDWVTQPLIDFLPRATSCATKAKVQQENATKLQGSRYDLILTDPPYYDAIAYADLMDFFYVWLRRALRESPSELACAFDTPLSFKWDKLTNEGELIDDASRFDGDNAKSKQAYEVGMYHAFESCKEVLAEHGRLVIVFAHKEPDAWETLVSAVIRAGFVVYASWPIQTEMSNRTRSLSSAALSSSVWLTCERRPESARPGWDNRVLDEMRHNIHSRLRDYWDAGIRGPDFVWAATGPAMEAYSKHPVVKKANEPGKLMEVAEFLRAVRRLVVDFVVGRVLTGGDETSASGLDDVTTYYILHRHDFGVSDAPVGPCILYAISCNLSDRDLADRFDILLRTGGLSAADDDDEVDEEEETDADAEPEEGTGSIVKLRPWHQRKRKAMGYDAEGRPAPLIDQVHRLMHLWKTGDVAKVDDYLDSRGLRKNALFLHLLQALIELSRRDEQRDETVILENLSNHLQARGVAPTRPVTLPGFGDDDQNEAGSE